MVWYTTKIEIGKSRVIFRHMDSRFKLAEMTTFQIFVVYYENMDKKPEY
jgi:hypothetical protein